MASKPLPKKWKPILPMIKDLVAKTGLNRQTVCQRLELPEHIFTNYGEALNTYNSGLALYKERLMNEVMDNIGSDSQSKKFLMEKLRLHEEEIELPHKKMITAKHAMENLSFAIDAYCQKKISERMLQQIRSGCDTFQTLVVHTDLEERIGQIEEVINEKRK